MKNKKKRSFLIWAFYSTIILLLVIAAISNIIRKSATNSGADNIQSSIELLILVVPAVISALIISRQPRNTIGWLLLFFPLAFFVVLPFDPYLPQPGADLTRVSALSLWGAWLGEWIWLLVIVPILLIALLFPTGRLLSPRWRWVVAVLLAGSGYFIFIASFLPTFQVGDTISLNNPLGFLPENSANRFLFPFAIVLITTVIFSGAAIFIRYRRAAALEREQLKWLFYAFGVFLIVYIPTFFLSDQPAWYGILLNLALAGIPAAIGISILRYRLWDIDILIRRTISYAILTGLLALVYFGSVILLQSLVENLTGEQSPLVVVFSTLAIAALFNPLRRRIQTFIDRRFYRNKYDAEQALAQFATIARDEVALGKLKTSLINVVEDTMQPESVSLWMKNTHLSFENFMEQDDLYRGIQS